jgi:hypothetical protein
MGLPQRQQRRSNMTLPLTLPLKLSDLEAEFSAPGGTPFSEFVRGGTWVPDNTENQAIPTELPIKITEFFGAAATEPVVMSIPQDPDNLLNVIQLIDGGSFVVEEKFDSLPNIPAASQYAIELRVRCNVGHTDGDQVSPQMAGYSWQRQRMRLLVGVWTGTTLDGVLLDIYFTSATTGYVRVGFVDPRVDQDVDTQRQVLLGEQYQDKEDTQYGNFVIPDGEDQLKLRVSRGDSGTTEYQGVGTKYACNYNLSLYERDTWVTLWKDVQLAGAEFFGTATEWNSGGQLALGNPTYTDNAECDLEFIEIEAVVGSTIIP